MWESLIKLVEGLNRTKRLSAPPVPESSSSLPAFALGCQIFFCPCTQTKTSVPLVLESVSLQITPWLSGLYTQTRTKPSALSEP